MQENPCASGGPARQVQARKAAIDELFRFAQTTLAQDGVTPASLQRIEQALARLAARKPLFDPQEFPAAPAEGNVALYQLRVQEDEALALYLNVLQPGQQTRPHNHKTWAAIAAIEGQELNRVYRRCDDGSEPTRAALEIVREVTVEPGRSISFMPEDIHSIHGQGTDTIRHLHMYGRPLDKLDQREGFDLQTGEVVSYNKNYMTPAIIAAG